MLSLPLPDGRLERFQVEESPIVAPETDGGPPRVRTYRVWGIDDPTATGRLSWTGSRLHALILSELGSVLVEPDSRVDDRFYRSSDAHAAGELRCLVRSEAGGETPKDLAALSVPFSFGASLRTFRLAVAATAEYTARVSASNPDPLAAIDLAYSEIVATVNAANAVYERDLSIRLLLLAESSEKAIIYTDAVHDPYTSGDSGKMLGENQTNLDTVIQSPNYDVGIVFDDCSGGLSAGLTCNGASKAMLVAGGVCEVESFKFQSHYLIHEAGHQLSAPHTINYNDPFGQRTPSAAYEIGSGSTIMSYAGCAPNICVDESLQIFPDRYFHSSTIATIEDYVANGAGNCNATLLTGNQPPALSAGADYTIPKLTPFRLTASATDADGNPLQYCWEENDLGDLNPPNDDADGQERPILRSYPPGSEPTRVFPSLGYVLDFANDPPEFYPGVDKDGNPRTYLVGESLPAITRTMAFRATARDGRTGVAVDEMLLHVDGQSGPFAVTSPNAALVWPAGSTQTVTWDVAGSSGPPVSCSLVDILLSFDNGLTFPVVLAAGTPNDGIQSVSVPADASSSFGRVEVRAVGNVFFDISNESIVLNQAPKIECPDDLTVSNDPAECAAKVAFAPTVIDDQTDDVSCLPASGSTFPVGTTLVTCTATDPFGSSATCSFHVTVLDGEGPSIHAVSPVPSALWPPNHQLKPVAVEVDASDNCDTTPPACRITSIASSEPVDGTGDGDTAPDWQVTGDLTARLRAERAGSGPGRTYTLTVECQDSAGNASTRSTTIAVPHN